MPVQAKAPDETTTVRELVDKAYRSLDGRAGGGGRMAREKARRHLRDALVILGATDVDPR